MKHCKDNDSNITSVLNVSGIRKEKDQRNLFKFSCLLVYFLPDLNRLVSHDLEKTALGLGTQNFDLAALTQLAIFVKRQENKVDFPCPVLDF